MDTTKGKFAFFFWGILFFLLYFKIFAFAWNLWFYGSLIPEALGFLAIILLVIPAAFLTARLLVIKIPLKYHMIGSVGVVLLFSWNVYDDHREKGLDDLITYKSSKFKAMELNFSDSRMEDTEPVEELMEFLGRYRVKKMKDTEWDSNVSGEKGFQVMIYLKGKTTGASIYENRLLSFNHSSYYKVLNGPVDMEWIDAFKEKHGFRQ
ncbi:hypothetical protein [Sporosarcina highlanderae]|uniref:Uncharacterized protein n=1 Tax=Sporosarcina highlanderae TaxID=3035916 RepID=A0ABT8JUC4_9BACL|nr:hypothetical protein [Sporosarcina highlanderae]MDN4608763.1 hypothetical protein [Sporosarcina highlanderae]